MPKKGKKGAEQRVKGNIKSASSGRMSELHGGGGFVGFETLAVREDAAQLAPEFQVVMKQLGKKDATTKLKALNEFSLLCGEQPQPAVTAVLSVWAVMYNKLSMDNDNRVREASHRALGACVQVVRGGLALHLKTIIGSWVAGMCDCHAPSASAAQSAFSTAFSPAKQVEVFKFCLPAIFKFAEELLLKEKPETFSDPRVMEAEECVQRYERAVFMTLYGAGLTFQRTPVDVLLECRDVWSALLAEKRIWKLCRHGNPQIRAAVFSLVSALCQHQPWFVLENGRVLGGAVLGALAESDPVAVGPLWEAALLLLNTDKLWSEHVSVRKALLPGLWQALEGGAYGCGQQVYPALLPLLQLVQPHLEADSVTLFFAKLVSGLRAERVRNSAPQSKALLRAFSECCLHVLTGGEEPSAEIANKLLQQLVEVVRYGLCESAGVQSQHIFLSASELVGRLHQTSCLDTAVGGARQLLADVAGNVLQQSEALPRLLQLLQAMCGGAVEAGGRKVVCFDPAPVSADVQPASADARSFIAPVMESVCGVCVERVLADSSEPHCRLLVAVLRLGDGLSGLQRKALCGVLHASQCEGLTEPLLECVILSLPEDDGAQLLTQILEGWPDVLPLMLLKLAVCEREEELRTLLATQQPLLLAQVKAVSQSSLFVWKFVEWVFPGAPPAALSPAVGEVFAECCALLERACAGNTLAEGSERLLCALSTVTFDLVQAHTGPVLAVMQSLLHWSLRLAEEEAPHSLAGCHAHLLAGLPDSMEYLSSVAGAVLQAPTSLGRMIQSSETLCQLLEGQLCSPDACWAVYRPLLAAAAPPSTVPVGVLEMYCKGELLFSPLFTDGPPNEQGCPHSLSLLLYPAAAILAAAPPLWCSSEEQGWRMLVHYLALAALFLQPSALTTPSEVEERACAVVQSALEACLQAADAAWTEPLLQALAEQVAMEGAVWGAVLRKVVGCLEELKGEGLLEKVLSVVSVEPEGAVMSAALATLSPSPQKLGSLVINSQDVCLVAGCLCVSPSESFLLDVAGSLLSRLAAKQAGSELALFESEECLQDPLSFSVLELMTLLVGGSHVPADAWDFVLCSAVTVTQLVLESEAISVNQAVLHCRCMRLCCSLAAHFTAQPSAEWLEFFQPSLQDSLLAAFLREGPEGSVGALRSCWLSRAVCALVGGRAGLKQLLPVLCSSPFYCKQLAACILCERAVAGCAVQLEGGSIRVAEIKDLLEEAMESFLQKQALSGTQRNAAAYILIWLVAMAVMSQCTPEARGVMGEWLKEKPVDALLNGLWELLADAPVSCLCKDKLEVSLQPRMEHLAYVCYTWLCSALPVLLRQWYLTLDRQTSSYVATFTTTHISGALRREQLQAVLSGASSAAGNMQVRVFSGVSQVLVEYRIEDFCVEIFVSLPESYPLQAPVIEEGKRARVDAAQWRKWLLQLTIFVSNQNGSLMDGLLLWKANLDKHFAGVDDCMICFSVIHASNHSLPKMVCRTCKKKFHSACLYKWFNTSAKSTCPLCRNVF